LVALLLVSLSVGLSNFAGAIAIGLAGVDARMRLRVALAFGLFEGGMPILGLLLGRELASTLGSNANLLGGGLLIATGIYTMLVARRAGGREKKGLEATQKPSAPAFERRGVMRLVVASAALSIDNLIVGFALGAYHVSLLVAALVIAGVSVGLSLIGLELGGRIGERFEKTSELLGGGVLVAVGVAIALGVI
jgi:putative Mn2+ efflux pump MntP